MISLLCPAVFKQIARLAVERLAELLQSADLYRLCLAVFEYGDIRHCDTHALRKLRRNSLYKGILLHGVAAYARQNYEIKLDYEFNRRVDERVEQIRKDERECRKRGLQFKRLKAKNSGGDVTEKSQIADLELSVRSFNALLRSGKRTVADILDIKDRDSLMSIKCLGVKSANEILSKLAGKGFDVGHLV